MAVAGAWYRRRGHARLQIRVRAYESKPADQLKSLKLSGDGPRREGLAIVDVDPESPNFGRIVSDIPIDPATVAHHIFYDRTMKKAYR